MLVLLPSNCLHGHTWQKNRQLKAIYYGPCGKIMSLKGVALHENRQYREACGHVLNDEWKRSATARLHMLDKSCDELPYNIAYLERDGLGEQWEVIGHSRLCKVHGQTNSCFVESVVIAKSKRGKGYGRKLMAETEVHAAKLEFTVIYLTTHDKQDFYHHVGYDYCEPIVSLGSASSLISGAIADRLFGNNHTGSTSPPTTPLALPTTPIAPPIAPPTAQVFTDPIALSMAPLAPPTAPVDPPMAPMAPPLAPLFTKPETKPGKEQSRQNSKPGRMDPSKVFWMKKILTILPSE